MQRLFLALPAMFMLVPAALAGTAKPAAAPDLPLKPVTPLKAMPDLRIKVFLPTSAFPCTKQ